MCVDSRQLPAYIEVRVRCGGVNSFLRHMVTPVFHKISNVSRYFKPLVFITLPQTEASKFARFDQVALFPVRFFFRLAGHPPKLVLSCEQEKVLCLEYRR